VWNVDVRADQLPKLYRDKARTIDQLYCGTSPDHIGPVQQRLEGFGNLLCLVVGQYGECSQDIHDLLSRFAVEKANKECRSTGRPITESARGQILQQHRRRLSVCAVRAQAACLLSRLGHTGDGARQAAQRRAAAKSRVESLKADLNAHWEAHIRGRRLKNVGRLHL
jgi:hypothetical protein